MEKSIRHFFAFIAGLIFMILPLNSQIFEGFSSFLSSLFHIIGFVIVVFFGFLLIYDGLKKLWNK
jgi:putative Mn2+ efflux pump MntP